MASGGTGSRRPDLYLVNKRSPAGILEQPKDVGILPDCSMPADNSPDSLSSDWEAFRNYPGADAHEMTQPELEAHIEKGHMVALDSHVDLQS